MPDVLKTVGRYEVLHEIGRGGMALVFLARQTDLDRLVALKELAAFHASDASFAQRFLRESRVAGSLSHPNIVTVHDYIEHDGTPYIAMEYVERGSLRPYVADLTLAQVGGVLEGLLAGLAHAEQHGIVHRDLKPENLMVTADGRVKIADFGIAKATNQMQTGAFLTATGTTVGTPSYMAPEQAMAQNIGPWTDLYSVGCMAFEMFAGRVPFHDSEAPMAILMRHVNEPIPPLTSVEPGTDPGISEWVERLLVKDPAQRTRSATDAWDEFEEIIIGLLGPRWRRQARLGPRPGHGAGARPLTPAPFDGTEAREAPPESFESFDWTPGVAGSPPGPATPPPVGAPRGPLTPGPVDVPTGPPTPPPLDAQPVEEEAPAAAAPFVADVPEAADEEPAAEGRVAEPPAPAPESEAPVAAEPGPTAPSARVPEPPAEAPEEPRVAEPPPSVAGEPAAAPGEAAMAEPPPSTVEEPAGAAEEGGDATGFVTFGAPARPAPAPQPPVAAGPAEAPPDVPAAAPPEVPAAEPAAEAEAPVVPAEVEGPVAPAEEPPEVAAEAPAAEPEAPVSEPAPAEAAAPPPDFETFIPSPPPRPPTSDVEEASPAADDAARAAAGRAAGVAPGEAPGVAPGEAAGVAPEEAAGVASHQAAGASPSVAQPPADQAPAPGVEPPAADQAAAAAAAGPEDAATVLPTSLKRPPEAEPAEAPARPRRTLVALALVAAVAVAAVAGVVAGSSGGGGEAPAPAVQATAGDVAAQVPAGYRRLASPPAEPPLGLSGAVAYAPGAGRTGPTVVLGTSPTRDPSLLSGELRGALGLGRGETPERRAVKVGDQNLQAFQYSGLRPQGSGPALTVFASPTSRGVATVACLGPGDGGGAPCTAVADSLALRAGEAFPVGPDSEYAATLTGALRDLDRAVTSVRSRLDARGARSKAQAKAAGQMRAAYATAAQALRGARLSPSDRALNDALRDRLRAAASAWGTAAGAARADQAAAFDRAERPIQRAERDVAAAIDRLGDAGYTLPS